MMSKYCPITNSNVVYLECLDCDEKLCEKNINKTEQLDIKENNEETSRKEST